MQELIRFLFVLNHRDGTRTLCMGSSKEGGLYRSILHINTKYRVSINKSSHWVTGRNLDHISRYLETYELTITELLFHELEEVRKITRDVLNHPLRP